MAIIIVVRHAESIANAQGIYQGRTYDTDLSVLGKKQANALAKKVCKDFSIKRIISSPFKRTLQTAEPIHDISKVPIEVDNLIIETNHGDWENKKVDEIKRSYPKEWKKWQQTPSQVQMPNGEYTGEVIKRVQQFVKKMKDFTVDTVVVTHGNTLQFMICEIDGISFDTDIKMNSAVYYIIENVDGKLIIKKRNQKDHLKGLKSDFAKQAW